MARKEIKQKIVLEGEKEYTKAIKDAQRNLRTLESELKAETAELGANATAQQKNEVKVKSLKQQIKEQEEIVKTYQAALEEVTEKYGDNEDAMARWEQKLNDARAALANNRNELERLSGDLGGVGTAMDEVTTQTEQGVVATKSFADALTSIGSGAEAVSSSIEGVFSGMLDTVRSAAQEVWQLISDTAAKANSWTDLANIWGTTPQEIQQWSRSLSGIGKDFSDLNTVINTIALGGKQKKITELLGVSDVNYKSDWEYALAVMRQLKKETESGANMTPIYEQIFGSKKSTTVMDLINNWEDIEKGLTTFNGDEGGFGLTTEELKTMNDAWIEINTITEKWMALREQLAAGLGSVTLDIMTNVSGGLDALNKFFNAETQEERDAALEEFRQNVEEAFRKVAEAIRAGIETLGQVGEELSSSEDPVVAAIGDLMKGIADALQWMVAHQEEVKKAIMAIFGAFLLSKIGSIAGQLAGLIAQIKVIKKFSAIGGVGSAAAGAAAGGATTGATGGFFAGLGTSMLGIGGAGLIGWGFSAASHERKTNPNIRGSENAVVQAAESQEGLEEAFVEYVNANKALEDALNNPEITDAQADAIVQRQSQAQTNFLGMEGSREMLDRYSAWLQEGSHGSMSWELPETMNNAAEAVEQAAEVLEEATGGTESSGLNLTPEQREAAENFWDAWKDWHVEKKDGGVFDEASDALDEAFEGNEDVLDQLDLLLNDLIRQTTEDNTWSDMDNLPDWWFTGANGDQVTSSDLQGFRSLPGLIQAAVQSGAASGVSNIKVTMDGYTVGQIVTPYVSQRIAQDLVS